MNEWSAQVDEAGFANIGRNELGGDLDGCEEQCQVASRGGAQSQLILKNMAKWMVVSGGLAGWMDMQAIPGEGD